MSLTPEEQRALALACLGKFFDGSREVFAGERQPLTAVVFEDSAYLGLYTAAVEAKERERCASLCKKEADEWIVLRDIAVKRRESTAHESASILASLRCEKAIRSLK